MCFTDPLDPSPSLFPDAAFVLLSGFAPCCWRVQGAGVLNGESNVLELDGETVVVGDLHGQFFDLLNLLSAYGKVRGCGFGRRFRSWLLLRTVLARFDVFFFSVYFFCGAVCHFPGFCSLTGAFSLRWFLVVAAALRFAAARQAVPPPQASPSLVFCRATVHRPSMLQVVENS